MLYNKLSTLPMVLFAEISESGDTSLLDSEGNEQIEIWDKLKAEYDKKYNKSESKKHFSLIKEIFFLEQKYMVIKLAIEALKFEKNDDVLLILSNFGYVVKVDSSESYYNSLKTIDLQVENIVIKLKELRSKLPSDDELKNDTARDNILKALSYFSSILGFDIDYYVVSVEKFFLLQENANKKIKSLEHGK